ARCPVQATGGFLSQDDFMGRQVTGLILQQGIALCAGQYFDVFQKTASVQTQICLGIQGACHANGIAHAGHLTQLVQPGLVQAAAAQHLHFQVAWILQQLLLQLRDHTVLQAKEQQQGSHHGYHSRHHAKRDAPVKTQVGPGQTKDVYKHGAATSGTKILKPGSSLACKRGIANWLRLSQSCETSKTARSSSLARLKNSWNTL